jgi:hypothetical protein
MTRLLTLSFNLSFLILTDIQSIQHEDTGGCGGSKHLLMEDWVLSSNAVGFRDFQDITDVISIACIDLVTEIHISYIFSTSKHCGNHLVC